jgi:hypothetical protein
MQPSPQISVFVKLSFRAILRGFLTIVVADIAYGVVLGSVFLVKHINFNFQQLNSNPAFNFATALIATVTGILGGYVTGRIAKQYPIYNSLALGVLGVLLNCIFWSRNNTFWFNVGGIIIALAGPYIGGVLASRRIGNDIKQA